jgi:NitT/TauT family transport system substrate-binding protein
MVSWGAVARAGSAVLCVVALQSVASRGAAEPKQKSCAQVVGALRAKRIASICAKAAGGPHPECAASNECSVIVQHTQLLCGQRSPARPYCREERDVNDVRQPTADAAEAQRLMSTAAADDTALSTAQVTVSAMKQMLDGELKELDHDTTTLKSGLPDFNVRLASARAAEAKYRAAKPGSQSTAALQVLRSQFADVLGAARPLDAARLQLEPRRSRLGTYLGQVDAARADSVAAAADINEIKALLDAAPKAATPSQKDSLAGYTGNAKRVTDELTTTARTLRASTTPRLTRDAREVALVQKLTKDVAALVTTISDLDRTLAAQPKQPAPAPAANALKIAYSDWAGWVVWDLAIQKGWFKDAGVNVDFKWFDYVPSMEAFSANKVDAVSMTNGDALVTGNGGGKNVCIVANDYSDGADMIVAAPGIKTMADLKGKKLAVEIGFIDHLLVLEALKSANLTEKDVRLVNVKTDDTPNALRNGYVDAIAAWQPHGGAALKALPGSSVIFSSANVPGIVYDMLCVSPTSLAKRRTDWAKVVKVWFRVADYLNDPAHRDEAALTVGARLGVPLSVAATLLKGTHLLNRAENLKHFAKAEGYGSIYGSSQIVDGFNVKNGVYSKPLNVPDYFDPSLTGETAK